MVNRFISVLLPLILTIPAFASEKQQWSHTCAPYSIFFPDIFHQACKSAACYEAENHARWNCRQRDIEVENESSWTDNTNNQVRGYCEITYSCK